jgi:type II secretory pathway pseudopilin PulG
MTRLRYRSALLILALVAAAATAGCGKFAGQADNKFGDQNFKTAIALIELYRVRHGVYPSSLADLDFVGDWDRIALNSVRYERLADGYDLDVVRGWVGAPTLSYPRDFWKGLGLRHSNVTAVPSQT